MKKMSKIVVLFCGVMGLASLAYGATPNAQHCPSGSQIKYNAATQQYVGPGGWTGLGTALGPGETFKFSQAWLNVANSTPFSRLVVCSYEIFGSEKGNYGFYQPNAKPGSYKLIGNNWTNGYLPEKKKICSSGAESCLFTNE